MTPPRDYYETLGVSKNASPEEIKRTYRKLAVEYHPDKHPPEKKKWAESHFKEVSEAYEVLMNPEKRRLYDTYGHAGVSQTFKPEGFTWQDFTHFDDLRDIFGDLEVSSVFQDFFDIFAGGGKRKKGSRERQFQGEDLRLRLKMTLEELAQGSEKKIRLERFENCGVCNGKGSKSGKTTACSTCRGSGYVETVSRSFFGQFIEQRTCPTCQGEGSHLADPCGTCKGLGRIAKEVTVGVKIPKGMKDNQYLTLRGEGNVGIRGGRKGDLIVLIEEIPHSLFQREGDDLYLETPITFAKATLGGEVKVILITHETASFRVPPGTQTHTVFRLKSKGMPRLPGGYGDLYIKVVIKTPQILSGEMKELLQKLAPLEEDTGEESFFDKIKERAK